MICRNCIVKSTTDILVTENTDNGFEIYIPDHTLIVAHYNSEWHMNLPNLPAGRLTPSLEWSWDLTESCASSGTGKLCIESHSAVFFLITAVIAAVISHREFIITLRSLECFHTFRMNRRIVIWSMFVAEYFPDFRGSGRYFACKV